VVYLDLFYLLDYVCKGFLGFIDHPSFPHVPTISFGLCYASIVAYLLTLHQPLPQRSLQLKKNVFYSYMQLTEMKVACVCLTNAVY